MFLKATCPECGRVMRAHEQHAGRRVSCPDCGEPLRLPFPDEGPVDEEVEVEIVRETPMHVREYLDAPAEPSSDDESRTAAPPDVPILERLIQQLLDPRSIQWMLVTGGGLMVVGIVVWLVSLGVFEDPRIVAAALGTGALAVVAAGCWVAKRTPYELAGQAVAFLGCVLLPLNIWFLHTQSLLDLGQLWIGGVVCCGVYLGVLMLLRSPLFVYAIEAGVTLTVTLLLYDLGHVNELHTLSLVLLGLGLVSIHLERAFPPVGEFDRGRYGLAVFWCGHAQLGAALVILLGAQFTAWVVNPLYGIAGAGSMLAERHLLAVGLYVAATYAYLYSDLVVRRIGLYTHLAGVTFALALLTFFLDSRVPPEMVLIVLAVLAVAVDVARSLSLTTNARVGRALLPLGLVLGALPVLLGFGLHLRAIGTFPASWDWAYAPSTLYVLALVAVAAGAVVSSWIDRERFELATTHLLFAVAALLLGGAGALRLAGVVDWPTAAAALMLIPFAALAASRLRRGRALEWPLYVTGQAATGVVMLSLLFATQHDLRELAAVTGDSTNLRIALVFAEALAFYLAAALVWKRGRNTYFAAIAACGVTWQLLAFGGIQGQTFFVLFAALGTAFLFASRLLGLERREVFDADGDPVPVTHGRGLPALQSGIAIVTVALVAALMQGLLLLAGKSVPWSQVWGLLLTSAAGFVAAALVPSNGWRRFFVTAGLGLLAVSGLTLNALVDLGGWEKLQLLSVAVGLGLLGYAHVILLRDESDGKRIPDVGFGLTTGSLLAVLPIGIAAIIGQVGTGLPNWQAFTLLTLTMLMLVAGTTLRVKATTIVGGGMLAVYLVTVVGALAYQPQTPVGVYLAIGGVLVFATGLGLSIYRERLVQLSRDFSEREGLFAILRWR